MRLWLGVACTSSFSDVGSAQWPMPTDSAVSSSLPSFCTINYTSSSSLHHVPSAARASVISFVILTTSREPPNSLPFLTQLFLNQAHPCPEHNRIIYFSKPNARFYARHQPKKKKNPRDRLTPRPQSAAIRAPPASRSAPVPCPAVAGTQRTLSVCCGCRTPSSPGPSTAPRARPRRP